MTNSWAEREFPDSAVVVAPTAEAGAGLAVAFDDVVVITLDDLGELPAALTKGRCAAVTGVSTRGGRLATVMASLRTRGPADLQVLVDLRGPAMVDLRRDGAPAMVGFAPVDRIDVYGIPCLRLVPDADAQALPDLHEVLAVDVPASGPDAATLREALDRAERAEARLRDLAEQLGTTELSGAHAHGEIPAVLGGHRLVAAGLVAAGSAAALALTSRDRRVAVLTSGVGAVSVLQLWYARRTKRRLLDALAHASEPMSAATEELVAKVLAQQTEIHRNLAIVAAAVQDTAAAVAGLAGAPVSVRGNLEAM
ncbi:MAG TPA: hypothetical protein VE081_14115 [Sporichthyaceae bacterium]|nr:hypothetical protein [Sporichthyaceae bacterium]